LRSLDGDVESVLQLQRTGLDFLVKTFAFEEGHRDECLALELVNLVNGTDVGVVQRGGGFGFALEAFANFFVRDQVGCQELQSDGAVELRVLGFVDDTHPTFTEFLGDLVVGDGLTDQ